MSAGLQQGSPLLKALQVSDVIISLLPLYSLVSRDECSFVLAVSMAYQPLCRRLQGSMNPLTVYHITPGLLAHIKCIWKLACFMKQGVLRSSNDQDKPATSSSLALA